jgi:hypothetical protein
MFDTTKQFELRIRSGGEKRAVVRWPTDQEWAALAAARKIVRRFLGRGRSITELQSREAAERELWSAICVEDSVPPADAAEISAFIARLEFTQVLDSIVDGDMVKVTLQVTDFTRCGDPVFVTEHVLRVPTQAQMQQWARSSTSRMEDRRSVITTIRLEASGELYDQLLVSNSGYTGAVPLRHKADVVDEVVDRISLEDGDPEL